LGDDQFSELDYELLFSFLSRLEDWETASLPAEKANVSKQIVARVVNRDADYLLRPWYNRDERMQLNARINALYDDSEFATAHLTNLRETWESAAVFTWWSIDEVGW
jgi:hypothetical protein